MADAKVTLGLSIILFWLILPIPLMWMDVTGFQEVRAEDNSVEQKSVSFLGGFIGLIGTYFKVLTFTFPTTNVYLLRFINVVQIMSALVVYLLLRGN